MALVIHRQLGSGLAAVHFDNSHAVSRPEIVGIRSLQTDSSKDLFIIVLE